MEAAEIQTQVNQAVTRAVANIEQQNAELGEKLTTLYVKSTGIKYQ